MRVNGEMRPMIASGLLVSVTGSENSTRTTNLEILRYNYNSIEQCMKV